MRIIQPIAFFLGQVCPKIDKVSGKRERKNVIKKKGECRNDEMELL